MRWMGLDFGTKTVGVAISDELGITAQPVETITRKSNTKLRKTLARIEQLALEYSITEIVLGYPKNMNNSEGARAEATKEFGEMIKKRVGLPVVFWDERLTTMESERILIETNIRRENRKAYIDQMAAVLILQSYMNAKIMREKEELDG
ncbi:MAG: Holliday junction resolvase RuvX [Lachnospiraceae bacterium]